MKNLLFLSIIFISTFLFSQVGISTNTNYTVPAGVGLSIDGNMTIRDRIYVGGNSTTLGNPGRAGQVLVSQGANLPPRWRTLNIPDVTENLFYLIYNNSFSDYRLAGGTVNPTPGISFRGDQNVTTGSNGPYNLGTARTALTGFTTITGLAKQFDVFSNQNQVYITFEAVAQTNATGAGEGADFVCGVFVGQLGQTKTLRGIRKATTYRGQNDNPFVTFTLIALADGLTIGRYDVEVACKRTANYASFDSETEILTIGRAASTANLNNFVAQTSLKVEVYEIPTVFNDIIDLTNP